MKSKDPIKEEDPQLEEQEEEKDEPEIAPMDFPEGEVRQEQVMQQQVMP